MDGACDAADSNCEDDEEEVVRYESIMRRAVARIWVLALVMRSWCGTWVCGLPASSCWMSITKRALRAMFTGL